MGKVQLCQSYRSDTRRQFFFTRRSRHSFVCPQKNERLSRLCSHPIFKCMPNVYSSCSLQLGHRIFGVLPILYIAGFKERKMDEFIPDRKNIILIAFGKSISEKFLQISRLRIWSPSIE